MFTGLVQAVGEIDRAERTPAGTRLTVRAPAWEAPASPGDSIAVNGVCLTIAASDTTPSWEAGASFDAVAETLARTTLGSLAPGSRVNLEHAARADTLMGGHIVQGHVDAVATVDRVESNEDDWRLRVAVDRETLPLLAPKGSVAIEGVSLTIARVSEPGEPRPWFEVALIPTTLDNTTLRRLTPGDPVNIETDIIARQVVHALRHLAPNATSGTPPHA
jgi:riboflavin synthase